jgi:hypothetical protein
MSLGESASNQQSIALSMYVLCQCCTNHLATLLSIVLYAFSLLCFIYVYAYVLNFQCILQLSKANPTIASYNASIVNFYNAMGSLARFENKNIFVYF